MLCPEVWNFPLKQTNISYELGTCDNKSKQTLDKVIKLCVFNKMVSLVLPGCETIPASIRQLIEASDYYLVRKLKLSDLVRKDFVEAFIKRGTLTGITSQAGIHDSNENVFAITPHGRLVLLVSKDLYQTIGIVGRTIGVSKRKKELFEITIDLKSKDLNDQSKWYNQLKRALSSNEIEPFNFEFTWESIDASVCPSSIAKFFNDCGYKVEQHSLQIQSTNTENLKLPHKLLNQPQIDSNLAEAVAEYFGSVMLTCDTNAGNELNTYQPDLELNLHSEQYTQAVILHCKGLLAAEFILKLVELARLSVETNTLVCSVNGYEKAPAATSKGYTITLINDTRYLLFK